MQAFAYLFSLCRFELLLAIANRLQRRIAITRHAVMSLLASYSTPPSDRQHMLLAFSVTRGRLNGIRGSRLALIDRTSGLVRERDCD